MNLLELHSLFQADENAVQSALAKHGLVRPDSDEKRLADIPPMLRDVFALSGEALCEALQNNISNGENLDATTKEYCLTPVWKCFIDGKLDAMRLLIKAGAKTPWNADQISIALGEVPASPNTGKCDPFLFACETGNMRAAKAYIDLSPSGREKDQEAVIKAVGARATDIVEWLLLKGFNPNAVNHIEYCALEIAVENDDVATAGVLLAAGADPLGYPRKSYTSPAKKAISDEMRTLFIQYGVNPARFEYQINPEGIPMSFMAEVQLTQAEFELNRSAKAGRSNPECFLPLFWAEQMRTGRYSAPKTIERDNDRTKPIWSFQRYGRSATPLPDGRLVLIGGEHEDSYDPDFCIYADVTVLDGNGGIEHFIYPQDVFPPTDFHSATLVGSSIWLIGSLGYAADRREDMTQVLRLDLKDFSIHPIETTGENPGWLHRHRAAQVQSEIVLTGGKIDPGYRDNEETFGLDLNTLVWRRVA